MPTCAGIKRDGGRCTTTVEPPKEYCWWHDPATAGTRKRAASKGGKSKPNRELTDLKIRLSDLADEVLAGEIDRADAAVVNQLWGTIIRAVGVELKVREQLELLERVEELESLLEVKTNQDERGRHGA